MAEDTRTKEKFRLTEWQAVALIFVVAMVSLWAHYMVGVQADHPDRCRTETSTSLDGSTTYTRITECTPSHLFLVLIVSWILSFLATIGTMVSYVDLTWKRW